MNEKLHDFIDYQLKSNVVLRAVFSPLMKLKYCRMHKEYLQTDYPAQVCKLRGTHTGERCFIIGNGPSLTATDLSKLKGEYTFAANRIYDIFSQTDWKPTFYVSLDRLFIDRNYDEIYNNQFQQYFLEYRSVRLKPKRDDTIALFRLPVYEVNIWDARSICVNTELNIGYSNGYTVTFTSIQLALYMGFTEIYLLGVDFSYSVVRDAKGRITKNKDVVDHFSGHRSSKSLLFFDNCFRAYQVAREYCDAHNITIKNATRGGKLEVFERVDFDKLFE